MKFLEKLNGKSKGEQILIMLFLLTFGVGFLCLTGCFGQQSCEMPSYNSSEYEGFHAVCCSIPGCGGCLTSGRGCNSACWPQSCKIVQSSANNSVEQLDEYSMTGCDIRYYDGGCLGCAQNEKSCYSGCVRLKSDGNDQNGFFYGYSDSDERIIGCSNGCGGCAASGGFGRELIDMTEEMAELGDLQYLSLLLNNSENAPENVSTDDDDNGLDSPERNDFSSDEQSESEQLQEGIVMDCYRYGRINTHGGTVASFKTSYVVDGGKAARVRKSLGNGWHIVSEHYCYSKGILWYELYDSQDGDYYGWVDSDYIDFDD